MLKLSILSPERRLLENVQASEVTLPGSEGEIQILPGHAAMLGTLYTGVFHYRNAAGEGNWGVLSSGFFETNGQDEVVVMAETIELKAEIDVDRARKSQQDAENALRDASLDAPAFEAYQLRLERALIRQQLARREFS